MKILLEFFLLHDLNKLLKKNDYDRKLLKIFDGIEEREIEENKNYKITTIGFCVPKGGDVFKKVLKWYKVKKLKNYSDTKENIKNF